MFLLFFFKQKTAYEMRISDWSSDVCSSDLQRPDPSRFQSGDDGAGIHDGSPARIDQHRTLAGQFERICIDQMLRLRRERTMDGYDVGSFPQLGEWHVGHAQLPEDLIRDWVEGQARASEPFKDICHDRANAASSPDPCRSAIGNTDGCGRGDQQSS